MFVYDGWNLIAELSLDPGPSSLVLAQSYIWGLDGSGSFQGAGGVGGLLQISGSISSATYFTAFDGNGNVSGLVSATDGTLGARYEYSAFGETGIKEETGIAAQNPFRFSTKYTDDETALAYYGYRYYAPNVGRWLNREPIEEFGSSNLYRLTSNNPVSSIDVLGLYQADGHFYAVYVVARANGLSDSAAYTLAYYAQYADQDQRYDAIPAGKRLATRRSTDRTFDTQIQTILHSLHGGKYRDILQRRQCLTRLLRDGNLASWERGFVAHALGDAFAHTKGAGPDAIAFGPPEGHLFSGTSPDIPSNRPALFRFYILTLNQSLGGRGDAHVLDNIISQLTQQFPSDDARLAAARALAQQFGYSFDFNPAIDESLDSSMSQVDENAVKALIDKIIAACCSSDSK